MRSSVLQSLISLAFLTSRSTTAALSQATQAKVANLWSQVEQHGPVEHAHRQTVIETPSHVDLGPDPTRKTGLESGAMTQSRIDHLKFNKHFLHGVASSAPQVEGAVKADGRGPSIWDSYCHLVPPKDEATNCKSIDVATNFRYLYPLDLARIAAMDVKSYSFSVSWSRVFPMGE